MNTRIKHTYREKIREGFYKVRIHPYYQKLMLLPAWIRVILAIFLFLFGLVAFLTPIPAGWVMLLAAGALAFGLRCIRRQSIKFFFLLRMHRVIEWVRYKMKK